MYLLKKMNMIYKYDKLNDNKDMAFEMHYIAKKIKIIYNFLNNQTELLRFGMLLY